MDELDVRELRYFLAVADELNFTRAAERLGIAQPPLSKAIGGIERKLGVRLFERSTRHVLLTDAGRVLAEHARPLLTAITAATLRTRRAGQPRRRLLVATKPGTGGDLLRDITDVYRVDPTLPEVEIVVGGWGEQERMVQDGRADVGLLGGPIQGVGLDLEPVYTEPRCAVLPRGHRLAGRRSLLRSDVDGEPVPLSPGSDEDAARYWAGLDRHPDLTYQPGPVVTDLAQLIEVVSFGGGIAFLPESARARYPDRGVVFVPMPDLSPATVYVAWPQLSRSPAVAAFVRAATEVASVAGQRIAALA